MVISNPNHLYSLKIIHIIEIGEKKERKQKDREFNNRLRMALSPYIAKCTLNELAYCNTLP